MLLIPELEFEAVSGTLGGCFTTVEGLLVQARDQLAAAHQLYTGDSATSEDREKFTEFVDRLNKVSFSLSVGSIFTVSCTIMLGYQWRGAGCSHNPGRPGWQQLCSGKDWLMSLAASLLPRPAS